MKTKIITIVANFILLLICNITFAQPKMYTSGTRNWFEASCPDSPLNINTHITVHLVNLTLTTATPMIGKNIYVAEKGNLVDGLLNITRDPVKSNMAYVKTDKNGDATFQFKTIPKFPGVKGWEEGAHTFTFTYFLSPTVVTQEQFVIEICLNCKDCF